MSGQRALYAADVKEALSTISASVDNQVLRNLVAAFTWVPDGMVLATDITEGQGAATGSEVPPTLSGTVTKGTNLVAKC